MRKHANALVAYESSNDEDSEPDEQPARKKRKLPLLSSTLVTPTPIDRPELHQGRKRTQPHVEGQWAAHVYISLTAQQHSHLNAIIDDALCHAKKMVPTLHDFWTGRTAIKRVLHISLSRPIYLRTHQKELLKKAVKDISTRFSSFPVSFAQFSELLNDERTRTFLVLEIGAGHHELRNLSDALTPTLQALRQQEYYSTPRFHASFAWALLDEHDHINDTASLEARSVSPVPESRSQSVGSVNGSAFPTIPAFPSDLVATLNELYRERLSASKTAIYEAGTIVVKIGKETWSWSLSGS